MSCVIKYKGQSIPEEQFLQYINKQITINNLFNENKTLANQVYAALGFTGNISFEQKQQAQQLYSQYLEQNPNGSIEGLKEFAGNENNASKENIKPGVSELVAKSREEKNTFKKTSKPLYMSMPVNDLYYDSDKNFKDKKLHSSKQEDNSSETFDSGNIKVGNYSMTKEEFDSMSKEEQENLKRCL